MSTLKNLSIFAIGYGVISAITAGSIWAIRNSKCKSAPPGSIKLPQMAAALRKKKSARPNGTKPSSASKHYSRS